MLGLKIKNGKIINIKDYHNKRIKTSYNENIKELFESTSLQLFSECGGINAEKYDFKVINITELLEILKSKIDYYIDFDLFLEQTIIFNKVFSNNTLADFGLWQSKDSIEHIEFYYSFYSLKGNYKLIKKAFSRIRKTSGKEEFFLNRNIRLLIKKYSLYLLGIDYSRTNIDKKYYFVIDEWFINNIEMFIGKRNNNILKDFEKTLPNAMHLGGYAVGINQDNEFIHNFYWDTEDNIKKYKNQLQFLYSD